MSDASAPRLIAIGETMALVAPAHAEPLSTAQEVRLLIGGAESNVAIHAAQLGVPTAWVSAVGDDALGVRVRDEVARHGVDVSRVSDDPNAPTGVYFKDPGHGVLYYRRGSAASKMSPATVADVPLEQAEIVHVSGITPALSASCAALIDAVIDRVGSGSGILSFDVNHRAALWEPGAAAPALLALARRADIVFVGLDEADGLWGTADADAVRALLPEPELLVVKDGDIGATEFHLGEGGDARTFVPAIRTEVVEAVGAGDAFAAGYLVARLNGADAAERLTAGHRRAHLVLQSTGDLLPD
ncbi:sugar kinase [Microbacterium bovistercoris]|uniref:Sugar kinase n=1 Tax=Microbacterium bovistercoris TaxID=2293570 RepID=A0A371NTH4_9MICO|nr:sugar kinase [Microbacterium bovistercoris]REJ05085.1 sugar kinase [Microbacterium bovistercoris]